MCGTVQILKTNGESKVTHTYRRNKDDEIWTVGYWQPASDREDGPTYYTWMPIEDYADEGEARRLVNYLNGGRGRQFPRK